MFMATITRWEYPHEAARTIDEFSVIEQIRYRRDGPVRREVRDKAANEIVRTDYGGVNLDINREPVPAFGDWESVARYNREPRAPVALQRQGTGLQSS
jgi:hypothetical protein